MLATQEIAVGKPAQAFRKQKLIEVSRIKFANYNPQARTEEKAIRSLAKSMAEIGLIYPVLVTPENELIDGHRRVAAARSLEWETVPAIVVCGNADSIYAVVNSTGKKMSGNDALGVWLAQPAAVPPELAAKYAAMEEAVGKGIVKRVHREGLSLQVFNLARRIARYCGGESETLVSTVLGWLLECTAVGQIRKAMEAGIPAKTILKAIKEKKPIRTSFEV